MPYQLQSVLVDSVSGQPINFNDLLGEQKRLQQQLDQVTQQVNEIYAQYPQEVPAEVVTAFKLESASIDVTPQPTPVQVAPGQ